MAGSWSRSSRRIGPSCPCRPKGAKSRSWGLSSTIWSTAGRRSTPPGGSAPARCGSPCRASSTGPRRCYATNAERRYFPCKARRSEPMDELHEIAVALVAEGKGILAADESDGTIKKRFDSIGVESTEDARRDYRQLLFATEGVEEFISGVIFYDETIRQSAADGTPFPKLLESKGVIPGVKVDKGAKPLANSDGETITEGLDGLRERLEE